MKKALLYTLSTVAISWLLLSVIYYFYQKGYTRYHFEETDQVREIIRGNKQFDIVFLGSSRAKRHINPCMIDSITGMTSYNVGLLGANLYEMDLVLKCFMKNHPPPKLMFIELPNPAFEISKAPIYNPNLYYEYLDDENVFDALKPKQHVYLYKWLPFARLAESSELLRLHAVFGLMGKTSEPNLIQCKGFMSYNQDTVKLPLKRVYPTQFSNIEQKGVDLLRQILDACLKAGMRPVVIYTPVYKNNDEPMNRKFFSTIQKICDEKAVEFWNYRKALPYNQDHRLFHDEVHLNRRGSTIFTNQLAADIKNYLQKHAMQ